MPPPDPFAAIAEADPSTDPFSAIAEPDARPTTARAPGNLAPDAVPDPGVSAKVLKDAKAMAYAPVAGLNAGGAQLQQQAGRIAEAALPTWGGLRNAAASVIEPKTARDVEAAQQYMAEKTGGTPLANQAAGLVQGTTGFAFGPVVGATSMGLASQQQALDAGATPGQALASGMIGSGAGALAPVVGRAVAPLAERVAAPVANAAGAIPAALVRGTVEGAPQGVVLSAGNAASIAPYDMNAAIEAARDIPASAAELGIFGAVTRGVPKSIEQMRAEGAERSRLRGPAKSDPFAAIAEPIDPNAVTQEMPALTEEQVTPATWQPHGPINTEPIKSPAAAIRQEDSTQEIGVENAKIDQAIARLEDKRRILSTGRPVVGPDETQVMPTLQDDVQTTPGQDARTYQTVSPQDEIKTQANVRLAARPDPVDMPTYATRELSPEDAQRESMVAANRAEANAVARARAVQPDVASGAEAVARDARERQESIAARLQRVQEEEGQSQPTQPSMPAIRPEAPPQPTAEHQRAVVAHKADLAVWAKRYLDGEATLDEAPVPPRMPERMPGIGKIPEAPAEPPKQGALPTMAERARQDEEAGAAPEPAPVAETRPTPTPIAVTRAESTAPQPIKSGDRAMVALKGQPFEARIDEVRPDGRYRLTSADGRTFPGVDPAKVTRIEGSNAPAPVSKPPAPAAMPKPVAPSRPLPANAAPKAAESTAPRLSADEFRKRLDAMPVNRRTPGLTDSIMAITDARAKSAGVSLDEYVGSRIADVRESTTGPSLNQRDLLQGDTLKEAGGSPPVKRGAVQFLSDGRAIIHHFEQANESTALHELFHIFRRDWSGEDLAIAEKWAGVRDGKWTRAAEEKVARAGERYVREGVAPTPELQPVFARFYDWLKNVYAAIKGGPIDVKISPAMKRLLDKTLTPGGARGLPERGSAPVAEAAKPAEASAPSAPSADVRAERAAKLAAARGESPNVEPKTEPPKPPGQPAPKTEAKPEAPPEAGKDLANYGTTEPVREQARKLDEQRAEAGKPDYKPESEAHDEATKRLEADYPREKSLVFAKARSGVMLDRVETVMAQRILDREGRQAIASNDPKAMADLAALHNAYRDVRGDQARALAIGKDPNETRQQRMMRHAIDSIYTPPATILRGLKKARSDMRDAPSIEKRDAAKARETELLKAAAKQLAKVREHMRKAGVDLLYEGENPEVIANVVNEASKANGTWGGALREFWINSVLSGPRSLATNATAAQAVWRLTADRFAEAMVNHMGPNRLDSATVGEFKYMLRGLLPGVTRGWQNAIKSFRAERPIFGDEIQGGQQVEGNGPQIAGVKGRIIRIPSRILLAADQFNKTWSAHVEVGAQAYRLAKKAGLNGDALTERIQALVDDLESPAWDKAKEESTDLAFQNEGGKVMRSVMSLRNAQVPGTDLRPLFYVMPFVKTPTNIVKAGLKASPLGALNMAMKFAGEHIRTDGYHYERDQMVRDAAQQLVGLAVSSAVVGLALTRDENGLPYITGAEGSYDSGKADLQNRTMKPYTIRIPGTGQQFDYSRVEPFATWFGLVADMAHTGENASKGQDTHDTITQAWEAVKNQAINKTSLQGVSDFLKAFDHGQQGQGWLANWSRNFATSWIPNVVRAPQRDALNTQQEARVWGDGSEYWWNYGKRIAQTAAPWTEKPKIGVWGQPVTKVEDAPATDWLYRLGRIGSPVTAQPDEQVSDLDRLLVNWNNDPKNKGYYPLPVAAKYTDGGESKFLNDAQLEAYGKSAGAKAVEWLGKCELHPDAPTAQDIKTITNILRRARRVARREVLSGDYDSPDDE